VFRDYGILSHQAHSGEGPGGKQLGFSHPFSPVLHSDQNDPAFGRLWFNNQDGKGDRFKTTNIAAQIMHILPFGLFLKSFSFLEMVVTCSVGPCPAKDAQSVPG